MKKIKRPKPKLNRANIIELSVDDSARFLRADVLWDALTAALKTGQVPAQQTINFLNALHRLLEGMPMHNGQSSWTKQNEAPKSYKYICNNCFSIAYDVEAYKAGRCTLNYCPHCGCLMEGADL